MTEEEKELSLSQASEQKRILTELKEDRAFVLLMGQLEKQRQYRMEELLLPPEGLDSIVKMPYQRGEIAGLKLAIGFVDQLIDMAQDVINIAKLMREKEEEDGEERTVEYPT